MGVARSTGWELPALALSVAGALALAAGIGRSRRRRAAALRGQVAVVIGGTRGLGLAIARALVDAGCRVAICGRDQHTAERARADLIARGGDVLAAACDAGDEVEARRFLELVTANMGRVDVLVTVAATIRVAPIEATSARDFERAMDDVFWSAAYPTLAVLPIMRRLGGGRIAHVTSIGGVIAVPHLVPYSAAKFAEVGFSEGVRAEVAKDGIAVTTIVPGLMRTGSHLHARFAGRPHAEYAWFGAGATSPFPAISAERAARAIVRAIARGDRRAVIGAPARIAERAHALWPSLVDRMAALAARLLPSPPDVRAPEEHEGIDVVRATADRPTTRAIERAARAPELRLHQR